MTLNDRLQICLLAVESRHPQYSVCANEAVVGSLHIEREGRRDAEEMITYLEQTTPSLLQAKAVLIVDAQEKSIYLPDYSATKPAFHILFNGHLPALRTKIDRQHQHRPTLVPVG